MIVFLQLTDAITGLPININMALVYAFRPNSYGGRTEGTVFEREINKDSFVVRESYGQVLDCFRKALKS